MRESGDENEGKRVEAVDKSTMQRTRGGLNVQGGIRGVAMTAERVYGGAGGGGGGGSRG